MIKVRILSEVVYFSIIALSYSQEPDKSKNTIVNKEFKLNDEIKHNLFYFYLLFFTYVFLKPNTVFQVDR